MLQGFGFFGLEHSLTYTQSQLSLSVRRQPDGGASVHHVRAHLQDANESHLRTAGMREDALGCC